MLNNSSMIQLCPVYLIGQAVGKDVNLKRNSVDETLPTAQPVFICGLEVNNINGWSFKDWNISNHALIWPGFVLN